jgi:hypothetical protein
MFYKFFISAKALVLMVIPNNYTFKMLFREYITDITRYVEDDNDEKDYSKVRKKFHKRTRLWKREWGFGKEWVCLCRLFLLLLYLCYIVTILINKTIGIIEKINMGDKNIFYKKIKVFLLICYKIILF